ncbi:hypothetical protein AB0L64_33350 [Kribbella sp. NPDC051936]|uniref:hypothetical protein n=1 Tax=Kribbella sp. NPDC051936 TaxID=3154946 RepID=UPI00341837C1
MLIVLIVLIVPSVLIVLCVSCVSGVLGVPGVVVVLVHRALSVLDADQHTPMGYQTATGHPHALFPPAHKKFAPPPTEAG